jgi:hypothetical protein
MTPGRDHLDLRALSILLDGEMDLLRLREARIHLARCGRCRSMLRDLAEGDCRILLGSARARPRPGMLGEILPVIREESGETEARRWPVLRVAAALIVLATGVALWPGRPSPEGPILVTRAPERWVEPVEPPPPPPPPPPRPGTGLEVTGVESYVRVETEPEPDLPLNPDPLPDVHEEEGEGPVPVREESEWRCDLAHNPLVNPRDSLREPALPADLDPLDDREIVAPTAVPAQEMPGGVCLSF